MSHHFDNGLGAPNQTTRNSETSSAWPAPPTSRRGQHFAFCSLHKAGGPLLNEIMAGLVRSRYSRADRRTTATGALLSYRSQRERQQTCRSRTSGRPRPPAMCAVPPSTTRRMKANTWRRASVPGSAGYALTCRSGARRMGGRAGAPLRRPRDQDRAAGNILP